MKMKVTRYEIQIAPENEVDEAYLEEVLGLHARDATARCERVNMIGLGKMAYLRVSRSPVAAVTPPPEPPSEPPPESMPETAIKDLGPLPLSRTVPPPLVPTSLDDMPF